MSSTITHIVLFKFKASAGAEKITAVGLAVAAAALLLFSPYIVAPIAPCVILQWSSEQLLTVHDHTPDIESLPWVEGAMRYYGATELYKEDIGREG